MRAANIALLLGIGMTLAAVGNVAGQTYPTKPIRIVTGGPGGGADFASRVMAAGLAGSLGQQVVVDNRGGVIPGEIVSQSAPDGYTLLCYPGSLWIGSLMQKTPYDPLRDFAPISLTNRSPTRTSPLLGISRPAMMRSSVDLPQPDGPSSTVNLPAGMVRLRSGMTSTSPKRLEMEFR